MRILTGRLKGRAFDFRANPKLRPTADKVRQAIMNILQGSLEGADVLDLFSGTGALGYEALSQGAASVTFVEKDGRQAARIRENLERLGLDDHADVVVADAFESLAGFRNRRFRAVFLDPPYGFEFARRMLDALGASSLVDDGGIVVAECESAEKPPERAGRLTLVRERAYGDTRVAVYRAA